MTLFLLFKNVSRMHAGARRFCDERVAFSVEISVRAIRTLVTQEFGLPSTLSLLVFAVGGS